MSRCVYKRICSRCSHRQMDLSLSRSWFPSLFVFWKSCCFYSCMPSFLPVEISVYRINIFESSFRGRLSWNKCVFRSLHHLLLFLSNIKTDEARYDLNVIHPCVDVFTVYTPRFHLLHYPERHKWYRPGTMSFTVLLLMTKPLIRSQYIYIVMLLWCVHYKLI